MRIHVHQRKGILREDDMIPTDSTMPTASVLYKSSRKTSGRFGTLAVKKIIEPTQITIKHSKEPSHQKDEKGIMDGSEASRISGCEAIHKRISKALQHMKKGLSAIGPMGHAYPDYVNSNSGTHVLNVGGNWSNDTNAGVAYANGNNDSTNANTNIGSRLDCASMKMFDIRIRPTQSAKSMRGYDLATRQKTTSNDIQSVGNQGKLIKRISVGEDWLEVNKPMMEVTPS